MAAGGLLGAALSRWRLPLLPLALASLLPTLSGIGALGVAPPVGVPLVAGALVLAALRRHGRGVAIGVAASVALFLVSGARARSFAEDPEAAFEARITADFARIRATLRRRTEELTVHAPASLLPREASASSWIAWQLAGNTRVSGLGRRLRMRHGPGVAVRGGWSVLVEREDRRRFAEFVIERGRSGPGLLTPNNDEMFLYHRAARDGDLGRMIAAKGKPQIRGEYDIWLGDGQALFVREDCRPEDREGLFVLHLDPVDARDLPPHRRFYGFDNRSFRFPDRALDLGSRCVARVALPGFPVRRFVVGRHPDRRYEDWIWYHEIRPGEAEPEETGPDQE